MIEFIKKVGTGKKHSEDLSYSQAYEAQKQILEGKATDIQIGAFWASLRIKYSTVEELKGFIDATLEHTTKVSIDTNALHISCGYDGKNKSLHILPASIFIAIGAGAKLVGDGEENVPSKFGLTYHKVLESMGIKLPETIEEAKFYLYKFGFGFLHQRTFNKKLYALLPKRQQYRIRSYINTIEKVLNPFRVSNILVGVAHSPFIEKYINICRHTGYKNIFIVNGLEGSIEINPLKGATLYNQQQKQLYVEYKENIPFKTKNITAKENARICIDVLKNENNTFKEWALNTASLLIYCYYSGKKDFEFYYNIAKESLENKRAYKVYSSFRNT